MMDKLQIELLREFVERDQGDSWYKHTVIRLLDELSESQTREHVLWLDRFQSESKTEEVI